MVCHRGDRAQLHCSMGGLVVGTSFRLLRLALRLPFSQTSGWRTPTTANAPSASIEKRIGAGVANAAKTKHREDEPAPPLP